MLTSIAQQKIVLASTSPTRARILSASGVSFDAVEPMIDESRVKDELRANGALPVDTARGLGKAKAESVSGKHPGRIVVGADQVLELDGVAFDKPPDLDAAAEQLRRLSGGAHDQISCVCVVRDGDVLWSHEGRTTLHVRDLSDEFIDRYVDAAGTAILNGPGAYRIEEIGAQLFSRIDGDFFTVLGLPLFPLLDLLRREGALLS